MHNTCSEIKDLNEIYGNKPLKKQVESWIEVLLLMLYRNNCLNSLVEKCLIVKKEKKYNYIRKAAESRYQGDLIVLEYFLLAIIQGIPPGKCYF